MPDSKLPYSSSPDTKSSDTKFVDPRLQAREALFQQLHMSIFETMGYVGIIQSYVEETGHDIDANNTEFNQLLRDYEITKNLSKIEQSQLEPLRKQTDAILKHRTNALANCAQLCAVATNTLNHWRILYEIPSDLRENDTVTKTLKDKYKNNLQSWRHILEDLSGVEIEMNNS